MTSGDILDCHEAGGCFWHLVHMHRTAPCPPTRNYPAPDVNSAEAEEPQPKEMTEG